MVIIFANKIADSITTKNVTTNALTWATMMVNGGNDYNANASVINDTSTTVQC
jgi:hypothetical protein